MLCIKLCTIRKSKIVVYLAMYTIRIKNMLGVRRQTTSQAVYGETGRFPLHVWQQFRIINYWINLQKLPTQETMLGEINDCRLEPYLVLDLSRKMFNKIARFRVSSHNLCSETGRHENPILLAVERLYLLISHFLCVR